MCRSQTRQTLDSRYAQECACESHARRALPARQVGQETVASGSIVPQLAVMTQVCSPELTSRTRSQRSTGRRSFVARLSDFFRRDRGLRHFRMLGVAPNAAELPEGLRRGRLPEEKVPTDRTSMALRAASSLADSPLCEFLAESLPYAVIPAACFPISTLTAVLFIARSTSLTRLSSQRSQTSA